MILFQIKIWQALLQFSFTLLTEQLLYYPSIPGQGYKRDVHITLCNGKTIKMMH